MGMAMNKAIACMMNGFLIVPDRLSRAADPILHTELPVAIFCHGEVPLYDIYQFCKRSASYSCQRDPGSPRMENRSDRSNAMNDQEPISVARARAQVRQLVAPLGTEDIPLLNANGRVLSATIRSGMELPPFTRAAMDGYSFGAPPDRAGTRFEVVDLHFSGHGLLLSLKAVVEARTGESPRSCNSESLAAYRCGRAR